MHYDGQYTNLTNKVRAEFHIKDKTFVSCIRRWRPRAILANNGPPTKTQAVLDEVEAKF